MPGSEGWSPGSPFPNDPYRLKIFFFFLRNFGQVESLKWVDQSLLGIDLIVSPNMGFIGGTSGKGSICQCGKCSFDPWVGKILWRREWLPTPLFLSGKFHSQSSLVGYSPWGYPPI